MHRLILIPAILILGCDPGECPECFDTPTCQDGTCVPSCGVATLTARTTYDDYQAATFSFKHAAAVDDGRVNNDRDLLFGNDWDPGGDRFELADAFLQIGNLDPRTGRRWRDLAREQSRMLDFEPFELEPAAPALEAGIACDRQAGQ